MSCSNPTDRAWEKLSQVAVHGAVYDSGERLPHPKCLKGTRVNLLSHIYEFVDNPEKSQLVWLHGTAGVGKSAVVFTVAERMRGLKASEETSVEKRLAGTFFFSRTNTNRRTTGYFFATLAYQLARNFSCVRTDVCKAIIENPAVLEPNSSLRDQMEELFLRPLRKLRQRQENCPPLSFVIDALDECISESELAELISLLGQALRESDLPKLHILLTSRSEAHVREAMEDEEVQPLVCEIPVKTSGDGVLDVISLDGADVDNDIYIFLNHSFTNLRRRRPDFPQPTRDQLVQLATRAGRRFIVASTMMKFIDDGHNDPRGRLQIMLDLTSHLLPGTEVYKLYDRILSTCADPNRAYMHLSVVASLADPLPASQISKLLGPGQGYDVETTLVQLRSIMDIPTDSGLPVNIYHSSVRDYVSNPSNCSLPNLQYVAPHYLLACSSLRLMTDEIPASTALLDGLIELKRHSEVIPPRDPRDLRESLEFVVQPPEPLQVLSGLLWVRGDVSGAPVLQCWLETPDGHAWLEPYGFDWLFNEAHVLGENRESWLWTEGCHAWLETENGKDCLKSCMFWLRRHSGQHWLQTQAGQSWLQTDHAKQCIEDDACDECNSCEHMPWVDTEAGRNWLKTETGQSWLQTTRLGWLAHGGWLATQAGRDWLQTPGGKRWLQDDYSKESWLLSTREGGDWLQTQNGGDWLQTQSGGDWMLFKDSKGEWMPIEVEDGEEGMWLYTPGGRAWLQTQSIQDWLQTSRGRCWLRAHQELGKGWLEHRVETGWLWTEGGRNWLQTQAGKEWLQTQAVQDWLNTQDGLGWPRTPTGQDWLQTQAGQNWLLHTTAGRDWLNIQAIQDWLNTQDGLGWLQTPTGRDCLHPEAMQDWLKTQGGRDWLQTQAAQDWLQTQAGRDWLQTQSGRDWLQSHDGDYWLRTESGRDWSQTESGDWLQTQGVRHWLTWCGQDWLRTESGRDWLQTQSGRDWLQTKAGKDWLLIPDGQDWLRTESGRDWLQTQGGRDWLQSFRGKDWLRTESGRDWLQTQSGRDWLQNQAGRDWLLIPDGWDWLRTESGRDWLQTQGGQDWLRTRAGEDWLWTESRRDWLQTQTGRDWLQTKAGTDWLGIHDGRDWLRTESGRDWLQTQGGQEWLPWDSKDWLWTDGRDWLQTQGGTDWLQTNAGRGWLRNQGGTNWLRTESGRDWLQTQNGRDWLQTQDGRGWLRTRQRGGWDWLQTESGRDWLQTQNGRDWLQTQDGRDWLRTRGGEDWLQTESGRDWLQTRHAEAWPFMGVWVTIVEFWSALEELSKYPIAPDLPCLPAFQVIQHLQSLPDFLMFPVFLALRHHNDSTSASPQDHLPDVEIIHAMKSFVDVANKGRERSQSASDSLKYACHNWTIHLARAPRPWDAALGRIFDFFWNHHLLYWLEMQWCSKDLRACLAVLHEGVKLAREYLSQTRESNA